MEDPVAAVAESIVRYIYKEDGEGLARNLTMSDSEWRQELRYEFDLEKMMEAIFRSDIFIPKLIMCDIQTISPFHYAALRGVDAILERFVLQHQIPVDMCVKSGSTALHFACFSGALDTVSLLVERFHADVNRKDRYGWTALHYASTEGNLSVIEYLVRRGADISARDKDGTTAAFRAQAFGHVNVVSYFVQSSGDDDLLLVDDFAAEGEEGGGGGGGGAGVYATVDASRKSGPERDASHYEMAVASPGDGTAVKGKDDVATLVRGQLSEILAGNPDPYMNPVSKVAAAAATGGNRASLDIGMTTLTRILKDEFLKFKTDHEISKVQDNAKQPDATVPCDWAPDYEDISKYGRGTVRSQDFNYDQLAAVDDVVVPAPEANPPPLPPRQNSIGEAKEIAAAPISSRKKSGGKNARKKKNLDRVNYATLTFEEVAKRHPAKTKALLILNRFDHSGTVMEACFQALVQNTGDDAETWKRLAAALPLRNRPDAVKRRIRNIELQYPADPRKQALGSLQDWRYYFGESANVDALIAAMKQCGLEDKVTLVEAAALEFNA